MFDNFHNVCLKQITAWESVDDVCPPYFEDFDKANYDGPSLFSWDDACAVYFNYHSLNNLSEHTLDIRCFNSNYGYIKLKENWCFLLTPEDYLFSLKKKNISVEEAVLLSLGVPAEGKHREVLSDHEQLKNSQYWFFREYYERLTLLESNFNLFNGNDPQPTLDIFRWFKKFDFETPDNLLDVVEKYHGDDWQRFLQAPATTPQLQDMKFAKETLSDLERIDGLAMAARRYADNPRLRWQIGRWR